MPLVVDLSATSELSDVVDQAAGELGDLSVLVNAAGTDAPGSAEELSLAEWNHVVAVNLTAPFALTKAVMPYMLAQRRQPGREHLLGRGSPGMGGSIGLLRDEVRPDRPHAVAGG